MSGDGKHKNRSRRSATPEERQLFEQLRLFNDETRERDRLRHESIVVELQSAEADLLLHGINGEQHTIEFKTTHEVHHYIRFHLGRTKHVPVYKPPGTVLATITSFLLTRKAYERYVMPTIADAQHEHAQALVTGHPMRARWIGIRMWLLVVPGWVWALIGRLAQWWMLPK